VILALRLDKMRLGAVCGMIEDQTIQAPRADTERDEQRHD
jgi:hypothetical protein